MTGQLDAALGQKSARRLFGLPIADLETSGVWSESQAPIPVDWRAGVCAHLRISGSCPTAAGQVIASEPLARRYSLRIGTRLDVTGWPTLTLTGIYGIPDVNKDYWFGRGSSAFFSMEFGGSSPDALFTSYATFAAAPTNAQGTGVLDYPLIASHVTIADVPVLQSGIDAVVNSTQLQLVQIPVASAIPGTFAAIEASWRTVRVPIWLITAQLLALCLLLLFTAVTEAVDARGTDIGLARLRGHGRMRTLGFGLSEPLLVLLVGAAGGRPGGLGRAAELGDARLRPGTAVTLPGVAWIVAAAAALAVVRGRAAGGFPRGPPPGRRAVAPQRAAGHAARLGRGRGAGDRGAGGLADLVRGGQTGQGNGSTLGLLVPGLLGLAVAVVASRVLPVLCRAFSARRSAGGLGIYLALRHIARRPGGIRTTIVLATAFTLATYAIGAWFVSRNNENLVARRRARRRS